MSTTHETRSRPTDATDRDWFDQYLTILRRVEAPMVRSTARMAGVVAEYVPERPAFFAAWPKVHDVMTVGITLRKRMVDEQTRFARQLVKAMDPMLTRVDTVRVDTVHLDKDHLDKVNLERATPDARKVERTRPAHEPDQHTADRQPERAGARREHAHAG